MAVTKLSSTRNGMARRTPQLSWPNDTALGRRRRPRLDLLRQATHNRRQHRLSSVASGSQHNVSKPTTQHSSGSSEAIRDLGYSGFKAHVKAHRLTQQSATQRDSGQTSRPIKKPPPHPTKLSKSSPISNSSLTRKKKDGKPQKRSQNKSRKPSHHHSLHLSLTTSSSSFPPPIYSLSTNTKN